MAESDRFDRVFTQHKTQRIGIMHGDIEDHAATRIGPFNAPALQVRRQINGVENPRTQHLADLARSNGIAHSAVACGIAQVMVGACHDTSLAHGFQHFVRVANRQRQRLFAEDMLARLCRSNRLIAMQFIGGGDINGVDFRIGQKRF